MSDRLKPNPSFRSRALAAVGLSAALLGGCTQGNEESCVISESSGRSSHVVTVSLPASLTQGEPMWGEKPLPDEAKNRNRKDPYRLRIFVGKNNPEAAIELGFKNISQGLVDVDIPPGNANSCSIKGITIYDKGHMRIRPTATPWPTPTPAPSPTSRASIRDTNSSGGF